MLPTRRMSEQGTFRNTVLNFTHKLTVDNFDNGYNLI